MKPRNASSRIWIRLTVPAATALTIATFATAQAAEPPAVDTSEWTCSDCPFDDTGKVDSQLEVGAVHVSDDSARFGRYSGLDQQGVRPVLSGTASQSNASGMRWSAEGRDLGLDSRSLDVRGGKPGLDLTFRYQQQPNHLFDTTRTPFTLAGGVDSLPSGWVRGLNTRAMTSLPGALQPISIESERKTFAAGVRALLGSGWSTYGDLRHQTRDGTWRQSAGFGFSALELPRPIDDLTDTLALGLRFANEKLSAQIGYDGSFYANRRIGLTWSNPYVGPAQGRLALAPDNSAHQLGATLNYRASDMTSISAAFALGKMRQDDAFLPYTINAQPVVAPPPRTSLDGDVQTTHFAFALMTGLDSIASFLKTARIKVDYRYDERDNRSPINSYAYVVTDQFTSAALSNVPYSFKNKRVTASGDYDLRQLLRFVPSSQTLQVSGGWRHDEIQRSLQEASDTTEDTGWGRLVWRPVSWLDMAFKGGGANRKVDRYQSVAQIFAPQNPLLRKYNMADRERQFAEGRITLQPNARLSVVATGLYANNDYVNSKLGLQNSREVDATFAFNWSPKEQLSLFADYGWEHRRALQAGSAAFTIADWTADSDDYFRSASAGLRVSGIHKSVDLDLRGFIANSTGDTVMRTSVSDALPTLRTRMNGAELAASWQRSAPLALRAALRYEHFDVDDRALDGVLANTVPTYLSMAPAAYDYDVIVVMLSFRYQFGAVAAAAKPAAE